MTLGKLDIHILKKEIGLITLRIQKLTQNASKAVTVKLLEETQAKLHSTGFGNEFSDTIPKVQETKEKLEKLGFTKI